MVKRVMINEPGIAPGNDNWLLLTDYASKYRVSVSTLRRRIKSHQIRFRFDQGRYFIFDEPPMNVDSHAHVGAIVDQVAAAAPAPAPELEQTLEQISGEGPILSSATRLLNELKRAYMSILQEKEEQLIQLKEEVVDLKTLVRVLESDNERLRRHLGVRQDS